MVALLPILAMAVPISAESPLQLRFEASSELYARVRLAVEEGIAAYRAKGARPDRLGVVLIELDRSSATQKFGAFRGEESFYPASVVKLFWLAYAHRRLEDGGVRMSPEFQRALDDMIRDSSNDATHLVVDVTTGTTGGPELPEREWADWKVRRNAANRWLEELGYSKLNVNQKTWCEGPYGRERAFYGEKFDNRNSLTPFGTARLMTEIALGRMVTQERSRLMLDLLEREIPAETDKADPQSKEYTGKILPKGAKLWSKAGWTSTARHDVAYVVLPSGKELVLAVYTFQLANEEDLIPSIAKRLFELGDKESD
jgi:beta-lactamase class A